MLKKRAVVMICHDKYLINQFPSKILHCNNKIISELSHQIINKDMLSILIPCYNYSVNKLVQNIHIQTEIENKLRNYLC